jgi:hypothetical protein
LRHDVGDGDPAAGAQDPSDLPKTAGLSGLRLITQFEITQSTEASSTGIFSASPKRNSTLVRPASLAFWRARSIISGVMSRPITVPVGPTFSEAMKQSIPAPDPMSEHHLAWLHPRRPAASHPKEFWTASAGSRLNSPLS